MVSSHKETKDRVIGDNSGELILCRACGEMKPYTSYFTPNGRLSHKCKTCIKYKVPIPKELKISTSYNRITSSENGIEKMVFHPTPEDYRKMYLILQTIGYDLNEDISKQFCDKYNLKYKDKVIHQRNTTYRSPKDLGMV